MSNARKRRRAIRWARYFNHYGHMLDVVLGGNGAVNAMCSRSSRCWSFVRRQAKHRFSEGRPS